MRGLVAARDGDVKEDFLSALSSVYVMLCRKSYTIKSTIVKVSKVEKEMNNVGVVALNKVTLHSTLTLLNFKRDCVFCGEEVSLTEETKKILSLLKPNIINTAICSSFLPVPELEKLTYIQSSMLNWFNAHTPFQTSQVLQSIFTGVVAEENINCDQTTSNGKKAVNHIIGGNFSDVKIKLM
ncbi:hypothetical protein PR048_001992 [Dryococelus australis]|uniref:Uncharacterized protein n=1 Tax=Dryococelus australis TaxID=614101 RepID=A0ABQ9ILF4_9NEOP|nr:hypothetical protein PR048_001992 [Dryococelus australis]